MGVFIDIFEVNHTFCCFETAGVDFLNYVLDPLPTKRLLKGEYFGFIGALICLFVHFSSTIERSTKRLKNEKRFFLIVLQTHLHYHQSSKNLPSHSSKEGLLFL